MAESPLITAEQWRQIVNSAVDTAIISLDRQGLITSWNAGATRLLGWSEAEMIGKTLERVFPPGSDQLEREIAGAIAHGRGGGQEGWRLRKDGSQIWGSGEVAPILEGEEIVGFVKILRDRTEQRETEEAVREERRTLEVLNRAGSALAAETDLERLVQIATDAGVELTGARFGAFFCNPDEARGESNMLGNLSGPSRETFSRFPMPRNTRVFAVTFEGGGILRSDDITQDPRNGGDASLEGMPEGDLPVRSYLAVPVVARNGKVIGGLFFGHPFKGVFTERSESSLAGLAAEAAIAIDNVIWRWPHNGRLRSGLAHRRPCGI